MKRATRATTATTATRAKPAPGTGKRRDRAAGEKATPRVAEPRPAARGPAAVPLPAFDPIPTEERVARNRKAAALIRSWMADESGHDEEVWPALEQALKEVPIRFREHIGRWPR